MARLGRGGAELWKNRMRGEVSNLPSLLQLASTLTWPTVERLGNDGRVAASLPSGGCVACCSPLCFSFCLSLSVLGVKNSQGWECKDTLSFSAMEQGFCYLV